MAIVRSQDGHFFEVPDDVLKQHEMKSEDVPAGAQGHGPSLSQGSGMVGPGGGGSGVSPVQIIVNYVQGGGGGGAMQGPPAGEKSGAPQAAGQDVGGRYCGWHNCWRNCWRNWHRGW